MRRLNRFLFCVLCTFSVFSFAAAHAAFFEFKTLEVHAPAKAEETAPPAKENAKAAFRVQVIESNQVLNPDIIVTQPFPSNEALVTELSEPQILTIPLLSLGVARDFAFVDEQGRITEVLSATPYSTTPLVSQSLIKSVLQFNAGSAKTYSIMPGDRVILR